jgi:hypothetical protein
MPGEHTVRVSNVSLQATEHDIRDFFSFSGEIVHVELQRDADWSQVAFVTFQNADALDTALLLSGATIVDQAVTIIPMEGYVLPTAREDDDILEGEDYNHSVAPENKATAAITDVLSRGLVIGKTAATQVKQFDEKHGLSASAIATATTVDQKLGISEKFSAGTSAINQQLRAVDERYQVSEKTKSALAVAEEKVNVAGSAIMKNRYVLTGASWVTGAFSKVAKAAGEVGQKAKDRAAGGYGGENIDQPFAGGYARVNTSEPAAISLNSAATSRGYEYDTHVHPYSGHSGGESTKPPPAEGLIL